MSTEQQINQLVENGDTQQAVAQIYTLIKKTVAAGNFSLAERWRERLLAIDSMALAEIIGSAELIEEAKSAGIDQDHQLLWQALMDTLSEEEANAFFYALIPIDLPPGTPIIEQGKLNNRLFFINQGRVNVVYKKGAQQLLLYHLQEGETAGEDTFFGISVATATFICHSVVKLRYLDRKKAASWPNEHPGLHEKILDFCQKFGHLDSTINSKLLDRRLHDRFACTGKLSAQLFNDTGQPLGATFSGHMADISQGGICFSITCSNQTAKVLLGRQIKVSMFLAEGVDSTTTHKTAIIVGVKYHLHNDYTVHIQFNSLLNALTVTSLADSQNPLAS